jgi:enamine deaminase RidA (YjgF/YER057c/UK114 family)
MPKEEIVHADLGRPPDFSRAVVASGRTVYLSGQAPTDAAGVTVSQDVGAQADACFRKLAMLLEQAGGELDDLVMLNIYLRDIGDLAAVTAAQHRVLSEPLPALSVFEVRSLVSPEWLVEIDGIAVID